MKDLMKKYWTQAFSLLFSLAALCISYFRCEPLEVNWVGVIVGILAILITLLIGWNIYSAINAKDRISKIEDDIKEEIKQSKDFREDINHTIGKIQSEALTSSSELNAMSFYNQGIIMATVIPHSYMRHIEAFVKSVHFILQCDESKDKSDIHENITTYLRQIETSLNRRNKDVDRNDEVMYKQDFLNDMDEIVLSNSKSFSVKQRTDFTKMREEIIKIMEQL